MVRHIACMMDGNRRWARKRGWQAIYGHTQGIETIKKVVKFCLEHNIPYVSLYTFSIENLKRSDEEKNSLFALALSQSKLLFKELAEWNVSVRFIGDRSLFPDILKPLCAEIEEKTAHGTALQLNFLFCYGARQELVASIKEIARKIQDGQLQEDDIDQNVIQAHMWTRDIPEPEIIIRTGGLMRLSNFLLYQSAYSEYFFLDCLWPELTLQDLEKVMHDFQLRQRNFGT